MTETEWLSCTHPVPMLDFLQGKGSDRKFRLSACGYCRLAGQLFRDEKCRLAIDAAEKFADKQAMACDLLSAWEPVFELAAGVSPLGSEENLWRMVSYATAPIALRSGTIRSLDWESARMVAVLVSGWDARSAPLRRDECAAQVAFLWCIFGNPFRPAPTIGPTMLAWNDRTIVRLAQRAYEERSLPDGTLDLARLAILADALEEAGVTDTLLLKHLRGPSPHVRGCFAIDAILGRT
jgi:hypothetical protein